MTQAKYDKLLARFMRYKSSDDFELWIVFDAVAETLGINPKAATVAQGEELWAGMEEFIGMLLENGFVAFQFTAHGAKRQLWTEQEPKQVMARIRNKWVEYKGKFPDVGFIVWFHNARAEQ